MKRTLKFSLFAVAAGLGAILLVASGSVLADDDDVLFYSVAPGAGHRGFLGVAVEEETENPEGGARITRIVDDSAAAEAGLQEGDIIIGLNGQPIRGPRSLTQKLHDTEPGDSVEIEFIRDGRRQTVSAELGERAGSWSITAPSFNFEWDAEDWQENMENLQDQLKDLDIEIPRFRGGLFLSPSRPKLGVQLVDTTPELRVFLGGTEDAGVLVGKVMSDMPAERAGIEVGDLIIALDGEAIEGHGDLIRELADKDGETIRIEVVRDHQVKSIQVTIPELEEEDDVTGPRAYRFDAGELREAQRAATAALRLSREEIRSATAEARRARQEARRALRRARPLDLRNAV
jgi:S1-C subfamily serine protease